MKPSRELRWGILAPGKIATKFATELVELADGEVFAVASRNMDRAVDFANQFGCSRIYDNYALLAQDPEVDIVYVASPNSFHLEHARLCLQNKKPVLCEKPLGLNADEVDQMIRLAQENNTFFMEAFFVPHQPSYRKAKEVIESGQLGRIKRINSWFGFNRSPYDPSQRLLNPLLGGGALLDIGLYPVFDSLFFLGEPESVTACAEIGDTGVDLSVSADLYYPHGVCASIYASFVSGAGLGTDILCEKGVIRLRRRSAFDQWMEVEKMGEAVQHYPFEPSNCGLKLEAAEAMRCLRDGKLESNTMPFQMSRLLMKTLDTIKEKFTVQCDTIRNQS